jgi:hypothetical protein
MGRIKASLLEDEEIKIRLHANAYPNKYWLSKQGLVLIEGMDFQHLENIVNLVSNGMEIPPPMQTSFENVMLTYLRKQAEINDVHKDIL